MSTPEALQQSAEQQQTAIAEAIEKLRRHHIDQREIIRVLKLLSHDSTAMIQGDGFVISRDFENNLVVIFENEVEQAA